MILSKHFKISLKLMSELEVDSYQEAKNKDLLSLVLYLEILKSYYLIKQPQLWIEKMRD